MLQLIPAFRPLSFDEVLKALMDVKPKKKKAKPKAKKK